MKGILPSPCRVIGYILLAVAVFTPMLIYMFATITDENLGYIKQLTNLSIWISLFMIFISKAQNESEITPLRSKALEYAFKIWGIAYILLSLKDLITGHLLSLNSSAAILFMVICVICLEFMTKKHKIEQQFKNKR